MPSYVVRGVNVNFPFPPYDVQTKYMEKVIECMENGVNGLLESPTGTGKTLSLLCSSLAWLSSKKGEYEAKVLQKKMELMNSNNPDQEDLMEAFGKFQSNQIKDGPPKIIYASRTHSQLSQAIQELKRSGYGHMKAAVIGSRDQLCIHQDVIKETSNANKMAACKLKIQTKTCTFHLRLEKGRTNPEFTEPPVLDIEDLVRIGQKNRVCPFFVSKDQVEHADIVFMPYNYLLDPKTRNSNNVELFNTIVILDEAHNVEKLCEDSTSVQLKSSDVATSISDVTHAMKYLKDMEDMGAATQNLSDSAKDFSLDDLASLKEILLALEHAIDDIDVQNPKEGVTFNGDYIYEILAAGRINTGNHKAIMGLVDNMVQFLTVIAESTAFGKKGYGLQKLSELLMVAFSQQDDEYRSRVSKCYRVHVEIEDLKKAGSKDKDGWISTKLSTNVKSKVVNYWCFSPNFAMKQLLDKQTRCIIMTSGTLAPMQPLISEMGIPIQVQLENPHIVDSDQICVKILSQGPDRELLISNYQNRSNPKYINSLGRTILSFCPVIPNGLLVFFPSYPILELCQKAWQESGVWAQIQRVKQVFVEPRNKNAFVLTMSEYYEKIQDRSCRGAVFMAVCRGKVSEGLDFANENGRAVIITGLPFPPMMDPRVILKKKYLNANRNNVNQMLSGDDWYSLEAARAVNQAIGRVIRHRHDYGAILLCDSRFNHPRQKAQLSKWIQGHLKKLDYQEAAKATTFGQVFGDVTRFFRNANKMFSKLTPSITISSVDTTSLTQIESGCSNRLGFDNLYKAANVKSETIDLVTPTKENRQDSMLSRYESQKDLKPEPQCSKDFLGRLESTSKSIDFNDVSNLKPKQEKEEASQSHDSQEPTAKKRKYKLVENIEKPKEEELPLDRVELIRMVKGRLSKMPYKNLLTALTTYQETSNIDDLVANLCTIFDKPELHFMAKGMRRFVKDSQKDVFDKQVLLELSRLKVK